MKPSDLLYCVDCEELFSLEGHQVCPSCGSDSWLPLWRVMKTEEEPVNPCPPPEPLWGRWWDPARDRREGAPLPRLTQDYIQSIGGYSR